MVRKKILIANRGEIAIRIIRAAKELGYSTVAIYSEADINSAHRYLADESICIGPADPGKSYLNIHNIISAAKVFQVDAIHPGYGFLAENTDFANICKTNNIKFIGPNPELIEIMGDKLKAKEKVKSLGIPTISGSEVLQNKTDVEKFLKNSGKIRFPVIIKAAYGGGGKGMRIIKKKDKFKDQMLIAMEESNKAFGSPDIYVEQYIENPKHIELQILGDNKGNVVHIFDRDCSIQRNYQKMIEEAPAPTLGFHDRNRLINYGLKIARNIKYNSAGTIEFLYDGKNLYFIEMNTRIQVEHPVSEEITDIDIVKNQIEVAFDQPLAIKQRDIKIKKHAIEFRINAENPNFNFAPSAGEIEALFLPGGKGIRVDTHIYAGYEIPEYYDSLIAKLIISANTRKEVLEKARVALSEFAISGIDTNIEFYKKIINNKDFKNGVYTTNFLKLL